MMNPMNFSETIFLFVLALIIFGPKKLPEIARQIGKYMNEFKRASNEFKAQIEQEIAHLEVEKPTILPPTSSPEGTASRSLYAAPVDASKSEAPAALPAVQADVDDEPLFAMQATEPSAPPAEAPLPSETVVPTSQESHV
jgi:sec-independent protein translocase protein TatB